MIYQLTDAKAIIARVENNFDIDYSDWITRAPLWIADALDSMQLISSYEDKYIDLPVEEYKVILPEDAPQDIRRILGVEYNECLIRRLNIINPIKQPKEVSNYNSVETYSIKNGYIITSFEEGDIRLYYQTPAIIYDSELGVYFPKVPNNSIVQNAIGWYLIYCMLRRGHKHHTFSLESNSPILNPFLMWEREKKVAKNQIGALDLEERSEMSKLIRTFVINLDKQIEDIFRDDNRLTYNEGITGQNGIV